MFKKYKWLWLFSSLLLLTACSPSAAEPTEINSEAIVSLYPQGNVFPLGLYSLHGVSEMQKVRRTGWNLTHRYSMTPAYLELAKQGGMRVLTQLPDNLTTARDAQTTIGTRAKAVTAWWDFPEERRWWEEDEMAVVRNYSRWIRRYDPLQRPNYMYIPGHYEAEDVAKYVPYLDIIPASVYTRYMDMPHAWVRWRMESTLEGIRLAKATPGPNYKAGEKTPVAVLELFYDETASLMTPEGAYHDFWQAIVCGAKGILIFSYWHKRDHPALEGSWQMYQRAASQLTGSEQLDKVILEGETLTTIKATVIRGPRRTGSFTPILTAKIISYPSIHFLAKVWQGNTYMIAVNSAEREVKATFTGLPMTAQSASLPFENKTLSVVNGTLTTTFAPLGVQIMKLEP